MQKRYLLSIAISICLFALLFCFSACNEVNDGTLVSKGTVGVLEKTPINVTIIGQEAYADSPYLNRIKIRKKVTAIEDKAFYNCYNLKTVKFRYSKWSKLQKIGDYAFANCYDLEKIKLPTSITAIGAHAFEKCYDLKSIEIPDGVETISSNMFFDCINLEEVIIPSSVKTIEDGAFASCYALKSISIPSSVIKIGYSAFRGCKNLQKINIPSSVETVEGNIFYDCPLLTTVGNSEDCNIILDDNMTKIPSSLFSYCNNIEKISIPSSILSIGKEAFAGCKKLTSIELPSGLLSIGDNAFKDCVLLKTAGPAIGNYNIKYNWENEIPDSAFVCNDNLTSVTIPYEINKIGEYAFYNCSNLQSLIFLYATNSDTSDMIIDRFAFANCTALTSVTLLPHIKRVEYGAFYGCTAIDQVDISDGVLEISDFAFAGCKNIETIHIESDFEKLGYCVFDGCRNVNTIEIAVDNKTYNNGNNKDAIIKTSTKTLVRGCNNTIIPNNITTIDDYAFAWCTKMTSINIPKSVTSIGNNAFGHCKKLEEINYAGTKSEWGAISLGSEWNNGVIATVVKCSDGNITL